ncbi:glutathione S-transferase [Alteromonas sp. KS69]|jgi:glutathione S-transferase|uniref:glutathione S-transferase family protein n=1 Tax=unclassified Alteromonas TaxID=2614992 RepID=UPI000C100820|nr:MULTISPECIES: glutathione S-transferase [unclassified Alteromonas]MBB66324.1 glutathione S-transferase [Rickettsiales bacterium]MBO7921976.1 glutathione S-transferase [Alteromonas sp. K632G]PHS59873.1 MAG: glutathione S-transferase [Alteromonas sp.]RUP80757.1 glutathione S-transferase [Alteromonas sp. KS69]|tara:strand:- start:41320 stop:41988 length:669 start_codon:yes stop_codon:yes gene_type:complete
MLTLHHLNNSRSQRILWLLEELGVDYNIEHYQRDSITNLAPESLRAVHPLGRSPVLTTPEGAIAESGAIVEYLVRQHGQTNFTSPESGENLQQYLFWLHFAEGSLMPPLVARLVLEKARQKGSKPFFIKPITNKLIDGILNAYYGPNLAQSLRYVESYLAHHTWFAGEQPTGADVQMIFPLESLVASGNAKDFPAIREYVKRVHARPAYKQALEKGGEYAYA